MPPSLTAHLDETHPLKRSREASAWEPELLAFVQRARAEKPALALEGPALIAAVGPHLKSPESIGRLAAGDLALAAACVGGDSLALKRFDAELLVPSLRAVKGADDDVGQRVREKLLVGKKARLRTYEGRAPLSAWLRLVVKREVLDARRSEAPLEPAQTLAKALQVHLTPGPEVKAARRELKKALRDGVAAALEAMGERDARLLKLHFVDGLPHAHIGQLVGAPRSTVASWLEKAQADLAERARAHVREALGVDADGLESALKSVDGSLLRSLALVKDASQPTPV